MPKFFSDDLQVTCFGHGVFGNLLFFVVVVVDKMSNIMFKFTTAGRLAPKKITDCEIV